MLSIKHPYGNKGSFKYITGYIHKGRVFPAPLCINLPKTNGYAKYFDNNNNYYVNLLANDKKFLQ